MTRKMGFILLLFVTALSFSAYAQDVSDPVDLEEVKVTAPRVISVGDGWTIGGGGKGGGGGGGGGVSGAWGSANNPYPVKGKASNPCTGNAAADLGSANQAFENSWAFGDTGIPRFANWAWYKIVFSDGKWAIYQYANSVPSLTPLITGSSGGACNS